MRYHRINTRDVSGELYFSRFHYKFCDLHFYEIFPYGEVDKEWYRRWKIDEECFFNIYEKKI